MIPFPLWETASATKRHQQLWCHQLWPSPKTNHTFFSHQAGNAFWLLYCTFFLATNCFKKLKRILKMFFFISETASRLRSLTLVDCPESDLLFMYRVWSQTETQRSFFGPILGSTAKNRGRIRRPNFVAFQITEFDRNTLKFRPLTTTLRLKCSHRPMYFQRYS